MKRFISLGPAKTLLVLICLASLSGVALAQSWKKFLSPAPMSPGHAQLEGNCDACHLVFSGVPNEKCLDCHEWIGDKQKSGQGFHAGVKKDSCQKCHIDHQGAQGKHTSKAALVSFNHDKTLFPLKGKHATNKCADCHQDKKGAELALSCRGCHEDEHKGGLGPKCATCHSSTGWDKDLKTLAMHKVKTDGGHKGLKCTDCHEKGRALSKSSRCIDCHSSDDKHGGTAVNCAECHQVAAFKPADHSHKGCTCQFPGKHQTFECIGCHKDFKFTGTPKRCSGCHGATSHEPLGECSRCHSAFNWQDNKFDHNKKSKFHLVDKHLEVACSQCHVKDKDNKRTAFRAVNGECVNCHQEKGDVAHGDFGSCQACHSTAGFDQSTFDHLKETGFSLAGKHGKIKCQDCHAEKTKGYPASKPAKKAWSGPTPGVKLASLGPWMAQSGMLAAQAKAEACTHCHTDPHEGTVGTSCSSCHSNEAWVPSTFDKARHASTSFALTGKHTEVKCGLCHVGGKLKALPLTCSGCHVDIHQTKLGEDCTKCHSTKGFKPVERFDHMLTGFEITKQHAKVSCKDCHGDKREKDLTAVKGPLDCKTCHKAGHAAFDLECVACHLPEDTQLGAASGTAGRVDHRDTGFPLQRTHALLPCRSCHVAGQPNPLPQCASCHTDVHGGSLTTSCKDCHQPDRWSLVRFDHDRAGFPLRGRHFVTSCRDCHTNQSWIGLRSDCFDCHAHDSARAAAQFPDHAQFQFDPCQTCHRSVWQW